MTVLRTVVIVAAGMQGALSQSADSSDAHSSTVIGSSALLAEGAQELLLGHWQRGLELTQMGLDTALASDQRAAALSNLCAAHAALKHYRAGLAFCDSSIGLDDRNWRVWLNRAACHLGLGRIEDSLRDIQRGLQLNPDADDLQKTLAIAQERLQHLLES